MDLKAEGQNFLKIHEELYSELLKIPSERELSFKLVEKDGLTVGQPRFMPRYYEWPTELKIKLRDHLQEVWNFFDKYSHWVDDSIMSILSYSKRSTSKKSIMFLLERDVWETDEVYGDYLIEKSSYFIFSL